MYQKIFGLLLKPLSSKTMVSPWVISSLGLPDPACANATLVDIVMSMLMAEWQKIRRWFFGSKWILKGTCCPKPGLAATTVGTQEEN
jgi:hypothetical protein